MTQEELIESIRRLNPTAGREFLAAFSEEDLIAYLRQLQEIRRPAVRPETVPLAMAG